MKFNNKIRFLSFALVILTVVMILPFGTFSAYTAENEPQSDKMTADDTVYWSWRRAGSCMECDIGR